MVFNQAAKRTTLHWLPIHDQISSFEHCFEPSLPRSLDVQFCAFLGSSFFIILSNIFAIVLMSVLQWQGPFSPNAFTKAISLTGNPRPLMLQYI